MPPETSAGAGAQADPTTEAAQAAAAVTTPTDPETDEAFDKDRALATIRKLRDQEKAGKSLEREHERLKAQLKALEDAKLSDAEKAAKRLQELETERTTWEREKREMSLRQTVSEAGRRQRAIDPELLYRLIDVEQEAEVDAAIGKLRRDRPYLFHALNGSADGGRASPADTSLGMSDMIRRAAGR